MPAAAAVSRLDSTGDRYVSVWSAMQRLGRSRHAVLQLVATRRIRAEVVAGRVVLDRSDVEQVAHDRNL